MSRLKLGVEVVSAHDLMPRDSQGTVNAFVELQFDGQKFRTTIKEKDLSPFWGEHFYFNVSDPASLPRLALEAHVYHLNRASNTKSSLGKVRIAGTSFVGYTDAATLHYPLEKRGMFSRVRGELGLKVFLTDDPSVQPSIPVQDLDPFLSSPSSVQAQQQYQQAENANLETRSDPVRSFHHLPREQQQQQQYRFNSVSASAAPPPPVELPARYAASEMRPEPPGILRMFSAASSRQPVDFQLKETSPSLGGGRVVRGRVIPGEKAGAYDLVERMHYLFVRVVKARELPSMDITGSLDPYVEVRLGNYKMKTRHFEKNQRPEWNEVFAFPQERMQSSVLDVQVKDKDLVKDDFVGRVRIDLTEVPMRVPPDSPLAPEWYRLEDKKGERTKGELMLAVWIGTQADECFPYALHAGSVAIDPSIETAHVRGKVYPHPRLWYVRVNIIEAQDIFVSEKNRLPEVFVKARMGNQVLRTRPAQSQTPNFIWNEDHLLVAAEPFEEDLILSVEDRVGQNKDEVIGVARIPLAQLERRSDDRHIPSRWFNLQRPTVTGIEQPKEDKFSSKIHLRLCLEGGYHVLDESTQYSSDLRPTMKQLWKQPIGLLELGILGADGLHPARTRDGRGSCDPYCVAKYGQKWVRTRTIIDSLSPRFNEQYTWDVYDHGTVLTVGVFDNHHISHHSSPDATSNGGRDSAIGKVRVRLSTLESGRVYTHSYPLIILHHSGVKKMGELHLAIRFSATSTINMLHAYSRPLLPKMHYIRPLSMMQQEILRHQAVQVVAQRLSRMEPPLRREVVEYMSDARAHLWSMRRSKANFNRLVSVFSGVLAVGRWLSDVCQWKNPVTTVLVHVLYVMLVCYPDLILPTIFLYMSLIGLWNYRYRPRYPPHMNTRISHADAAHPDELDEEFDEFPTKRHEDIVRMRYDRLRNVAGRIQMVVGDVATQGERLQALLSWRDPRATAVFLFFCLGTAVTLYGMPFQVLAVGGGFYTMRHPRFRHRLPPVVMNFFRRLPAKTDSLI